MKRVTGIGGVFFKSKNPSAINEWYKMHLGLDTGEYGTNFDCRQIDDSNKKGTTVWCPFKEETQYFKPSDKEFMINFRVENLEELLKLLVAEGVEIVGDMEASDFGKFAHIMDPEGNKIELWEPVDEALEK